MESKKKEPITIAPGPDGLWRKVDPPDVVVTDLNNDPELENKAREYCPDEDLDGACTREAFSHGYMDGYSDALRLQDERIAELEAQRELYMVREQLRRGKPGE